MGRETVVERLHVSRLGPALRSVASRASLPYWLANGRPAPAPPHRKRAIISSYVSRFEPEIFVETGTYRGDTLAAVRKLVPRVISIELDERLGQLARARFDHRENIEILIGDSAAVLPGLVAGFDRPALFWLDGHFSNGVTALGDHVTPIEHELAVVLGDDQPAHLVLIDDARLFNGTDGYPTIAGLRDLVGELRPEWRFAVEDDIIRVHAAP